MRDETLQLRKLWLGKLLKRSVDGILYNDHETGAIGPRLFEQACKMGLAALDQGQKSEVAVNGPGQRWQLVKRFGSIVDRTELDAGRSISRRSR